MITVTDAAASKIKSLLEQQGKPGYGLRMRVVGGGCSGLQYQLNFEEKANATDRVLETKGIKIFIDMKSSLYLVGSELDYVDGLMGAGFKINNPNAKSTCGCGESFQA
ncbi:MAG TPA: iron-sulfur cluster insertion protein ErpA [Candidatus Limnocylindrales bacterium]|nr:iron-sulfur cluster insertion protein ErpA [Candidatus Limnocylindrales bacterium]